MPAEPGTPDWRDCCLVQQEKGCCLASRAGNAESEGSAAFGKGERPTPPQKRPYYDLSDTSSLLQRGPPGPPPNTTCCHFPLAFN